MTRAELLKVAKPILFNTEMTRAILEDRKKVTRRCVKFEGNRNPNWTGYIKDGLTLYNGTNEPCNKPAPFKIGDVMYVRETWRVGAWDIRNQMIAFDYKDGTCGKLTYMQDRNLFERLVNQSREDARKARCEYNGADFVWEKGKSPCRWHPSIHMPKEAARIFLKVKDVRVERLQDITEDEVEREGIKPRFKVKDSFSCDIAKSRFMELWDSTIQKADIERYGWDANPYVFCISFERIYPEE